MLDWLERHWPQATTFVLFILGYGKLQWDVNELKKKEIVTKDICRLQRESCGGENTVLFEAGKEKFNEIHSTVERLEKELKVTVRIIENKIDTNHQVMMDKIIEVIRNQTK